MESWIGVDLDGTLAYYDESSDVSTVGDPIPLMLERVKRWRAEGITVKIFTARVAEGDVAQIQMINRWSLRHIGERLPITNVKDFRMIELWDDRAVTVEKNTGRIIQARV